MSKIIFLAHNQKLLYDCYTKTQLSQGKLISINDLGTKDLSTAHYLFSTWTMPALEENCIKTTFPNLKGVFYAAGSVQSFARPFLKSGVRVFSAWMANAIPVAEFTVAQIILANKGYFQLHNRYKKDGIASTRKYSTLFDGNYKAKVGLLGAGMIGKLVINLLKSYNIEIYVFDPFMSKEHATDLGIKKATLEKIFSECVTISNHLANNEHTQKILDYSLFSKMKENATFINTGRGAQLVPKDLIKAMKDFPTRTALLDVTDPQEPLEHDNALWECENIFISPHRAGSISKEVLRMGEYMWDEYTRILQNQTSKYEVTMEMLTTMA